MKKLNFTSLQVRDEKGYSIPPKMSESPESEIFFFCHGLSMNKNRTDCSHHLEKNKAAYTAQDAPSIRTFHLRK